MVYLSIQKEAYQLSGGSQRILVFSLQTQGDYAQLLDCFGVRRTSPNFWVHADNVYEISKRNSPKDAGIFDFSRLENR